MTTADQSSTQLRVADLHVEVHIAADANTVWEALTSDIGKWWPSAFYCGGGSAGDDRRTIVLDARPGGLMLEDWGNGDGILWATVVNVYAGKTLEMTGVMGPAWGGPSTSYNGFALEEDGDGTRLRFVLFRAGHGRDHRGEGERLAFPSGDAAVICGVDGAARVGGLCVISSGTAVASTTQANARSTPSDRTGRTAARWSSRRAGSTGWRRPA